MWRSESKNQTYLPAIDSQNYLGTLQTIEAQSQFSIDLKNNDNDSLLCKILMLSIELQRKQIIIGQQSEVQNGAFQQVQQINLKYLQIVEQNKALIESNNNLKANVLTLEKITRQMQGFKNQKQYAVQLQEKLQKLQIKLKRLQQQKIEADQHINRLKVQNSMISFDKAKLQGNDKNRIRDLQQEIQHEKHKLQTEKKVNAQLSILVDSYTNQIRKLKDREGYLTRSYQQQVRILQADVHHSQNLKRSQFNATQQKIVLMSQELHRLKGEVQQLRMELRQKIEIIDQKDRQIRTMKLNIEGFQSQYKNFKKQIQGYTQQAQSKQQELIQYRAQVKEISKESKKYKQTNNQLKLELAQKQNQISLKNHEVSQLKRQVYQLNQQIQYQQSQLKKTRKRDNSVQQCENCKVFGSKSLIQMPSKPLINLSQLIEQTEKLQMSNRKVENLLNINQNCSILMSNKTYYDYQ